MESGTCFFRRSQAHGKFTGHKPVWRFGVNALICKGLSQQRDFSILTLSNGGARVLAGGFPSMSTPRAPSRVPSNAPSSEEAKPGFRTKTIATRTTPDELREIETAAEREGKSLAEWLREMALKAARQRPVETTELLLAEVWALRYTLLNLFHSGAQAALEGKLLLPDSILEIRDDADAQKLQKARKLLEDFLAQGGPDGGKK